MRRLMYLTAEQKDVYCNLFNYRSQQFEVVNFAQFIEYVLNNEIQNFKQKGKKLECIDGSSRSIYVKYSDEHTQKNYGTVLQSGANIKFNSKEITLPKFRQAYDKYIDPLKMIHILAKLGNTEKYIIQSNECKAKVVGKKQLERYMLENSKDTKLVNAKIVDGNLSALKGHFVQLDYSKGAVAKKSIQIDKKQNKDSKKSWGTLISYKQFYQYPAREQKYTQAIQNIGFIGQQFYTDFNEHYKNQRYKEILTGHNRYLILRQIDRIQVNPEKCYEISYINGYRTLNQQLNRIIRKIKKQPEYYTKQSKWASHYKRTIKAIQNKKEGYEEEAEITRCMLQDCIEYRIKNDKAIRNYLKTYEYEIKYILKSDQLLYVFLLALYVDFLHAGNFNSLKVADQTVFVAAALRINYIIHFKSYTFNQMSECMQLVNKMESDTNEITSFIQQNTILKCRKLEYVRFNSQLDKHGLKGVYTENIENAIDINHYKIIHTAFKTSSNIQQIVFKLDLERNYKTIVDNLQYQYKDTNDVEWHLNIDSNTARIESQDEQFGEIELFQGKEIRKIQENLYIICGKPDQYNRGNWKNNRDKIEQRILYLAERTGKSGRTITDVIYAPFRMCVNYADFVGCSDKISCFNIRIVPKTIGNKIYYLVKQNGLLQCLAPDSQNFNDYGSNINTDNHSYSEMDTDRPLLFTQFGTGQQCKTYYQFNSNYYKFKHNSGGNIKSYRQEIYFDINNIFIHLDNALKY